MGPGNCCGLAVAAAVVVHANAGPITPSVDEAIERGVVYEIGQQIFGLFGYGAGFADLDADGDPDIILLGYGDQFLDGSYVGLFENDGTGNFTDRSFGNGIPVLGDPSGFAAGDIDGDGKKELVAASYSSGLWLFRPGTDPKSAWTKELIDRDSAGFEHAAILTDLDGDGRDELYVASDKHKQVRRYVWKNGRSSREVIYKRPDNRPIFTWNLMPVPVSLIPSN